MSNQRQRSRSYPILNLEDARELIRSIAGDSKETGCKAWTPGELADLFGYSKSSGIALRKVSTLQQFGFLEKDSGTEESEASGLLSLTELAEALVQDALQAEKEGQLLLQALREAEPFAKLADEIQARGVVPAPIERHLREHRSEYGLTAAACEEFGKIFLESAQYAGFLTEDNQLTRRYHAVSHHPAFRSTPNETPDGLEESSLEFVFPAGRRGRIVLAVTPGCFADLDHATLKKKILQAAEDLVDHQIPLEKDSSSVVEASDRFHGRRERESS